MTGAIPELLDTVDVLEQRNKNLMVERRQLKQRIHELEEYNKKKKRNMDNKLRRWSPDESAMSFSGDDNGSWVSWHDVQELLAENERLRTTRPEPSRLEIAAMMMGSMLSSGDIGGIDLTAGQCADLLGVEKYENSKHYPQICALFAFRFADALIAAAKGGE